MKEYTKPELTSSNNERIVTVVAASAVGMLLGLAATKKVMEIHAESRRLPGLESVLAYE